MTIEEWRKVIKKYFPDFVLAAEIGLSVFCQLRIADVSNPFGLVFIDVPSSGKTITLNFFSESKKLIYITDNFTAASFVSNAANRSEEELKKIDILPQIKNKVFIVRDFAPIFGQRDDDILKTFGILTRVFDGEGLITNSGIYGQRKHEGKHLFMFLAASTEIRPRVWKVMGNFGSRLFFYRLNTPDKTPKELARQLSSKLSPKSKEKRCRAATKELLDTIFDFSPKIKWNKSAEDPKLLEEIAIISTLLASLRGVINVWKDSILDDEKHNFTQPQIEKPSRINQSFFNLARGHAVAVGREYLEDIDIAIALEVTLSSASCERAQMFNLLIKHKGKLTADIIIDELRFSRPTALKYMAMFNQLNIVETSEVAIKGVGKMNKMIVLRKEFSWFLSDRFQELKGILRDTFD